MTKFKLNPRKILVTSALPYANGSIHIGHLVEYIQSDIWVRFQRMRGNQCLHICGSDCHGTAIMLHAEKSGVDPEILVAKICAEHARDFRDFFINFDNYYTTHSEENRELCCEIYERLKQQKDIDRKGVSQAYDIEKNIFLPDRFVKGICPKCGAEDQYGDSCEECGATYSPVDLKNPVSAISGTTPVTKTSDHLFFRLSRHQKKLKTWISAGHLQEQVVNKMSEWFDHGLKDWDISRDSPYFGFKIPGEKDKYFYVWLDAPIGYMASFKNLCEMRDDLDFDEFWSKESKCELYHFLGKDIMYFHALFWPAVLMSAGFRTPNGMFVHGFLTIDGNKMSKSRGTFIKARTYLKHLKPEYLRYYFAAKLTSQIEDVDLNLEDFRLRINSDLIGKVVNIASRCSGFVNKHFAGKISDINDRPSLFKEFADCGESIANFYEEREYASAMRKIMWLADKANKYIDERKPWQLIKDNQQADSVQHICSLGLNLFRLLILYLKPVLPLLAKNSESFLNIPELFWPDSQNVLRNHIIKPFEPLMFRIEKDEIVSILSDSVESRT